MSIWNIKEINTKREILDKNIEVDTLIIGAGMTGMNVAYMLRDNKQVCVVDANIVGHGVTLNSTAKINYFQGRIYTKIEKSINKISAIKYLKAEKEAIEILINIIKEEKIDCDLKKVESYVFANIKSEIEPLKKEIKFLIDNGIDIVNKKLPNKITSYNSYSVKDTYIFNPIKYLQGIYNILIEHNISIYENTKITKIEKINNYYMCYSSKYKIKAKKVVVATSYPYFIKPLFLPFKSTLEKSYIIVSKVNKDQNFTCISSSNPTYSCRFYSDKNNIYQISLSESHNTSVSQNDKYHFNRVKEIFKLDEKDIIMKYSNTDIITADNIPYIGKIDENMYISTGYNTWGMTNSVIGAKIITDMINNNENEYTDLFNPNRINKSNIIKFPLILFSSIKSYVGPKINKNKFWYKNIKFKTENGKCLAIYKDKNGFEHVIYNKCPHMGCSLIFNEEEKTWDCPCHSSRFDIDGRCIKGPSNCDITYKK